MSPPDLTAYSVDQSLADWDVTPAAWMRQHGHDDWDGLAVSVVVFNGGGRVLLVQRAAHDSMPNRWEVPGGGASEPHESLLLAAARELWEEAGLVATRFTALVPLRAVHGVEGMHEVSALVAAADHPGHVFHNRTGTRLFGRFAFRADVQQTATVVLDPNEHQDYVWATEAEVRLQRQLGDDGSSSNKALPLTHPATQAFILEAFRQAAEAADRQTVLS